MGLPRIFLFHGSNHMHHGVSTVLALNANQISPLIRLIGACKMGRAVVFDGKLNEKPVRRFTTVYSIKLPLSVAICG